MAVGGNIGRIFNVVADGRVHLNRVMAPTTSDNSIGRYCETTPGIEVRSKATNTVASAKADYLRSH
jgi:hypothetical protein